MDSISYVPLPVHPHIYEGIGIVPHRAVVPRGPQAHQSGRTPKAKRRRKAHESFGPNPPLSTLQKVNKRKTKKHFGGRHPSGTPRSVPPAPANSNSFLMSSKGLTPVLGTVISNTDTSHHQFHSRTPNPLNPGTTWKNGLGSLGNEAAAEISALAGLDFFGSNVGLITKKDGIEGDSFSDTSESDPEDLGFELHLQCDAEAPMTAGAKARLEEQTAYIAELEEQNMTLREKLFLLEQQLEEQRR